MLYMKCEYCVCSGVLKLADDGEIIEEEICPMCDGVGYHRHAVENNIDSMRRWSVLRMLDLTYPEHKHRDRTKRLMDLYYIVPMVDEPEITPEAAKLSDNNKEEDDE